MTRTLRRALTTTTLVSLLAAAGTALLVSAPAQAHDGVIQGAATCATDGATVDWTLHNDWNTTMTIVSSDSDAFPTSGAGATVSPNGTAHYTEHLGADAAGTTITHRLKVDWPDHYAKDTTASVTIPENCTGSASVTVALPAITPPSCTADGTLVLPTERTDDGAYVGTGYTMTVTPAYAGPGTYAVHAEPMASGDDAAFPWGTVLTGATDETVTVLAATPTQSTDAAADCYVAVTPPTTPTTPPTTPTTPPTTPTTPPTTPVTPNGPTTPVTPTAPVTPVTPTVPVTPNATTVPPTVPAAVTNTPAATTTPITVAATDGGQRLAFTGTDPWVAPAGIAALLALLAGIALLVFRTVRNRRTAR